MIINDRPLRQTLTGVGHYIAQLLRHLPAAAEGVRADPFYYTYLARRDWREGERAWDARGRQPREVGGSRKPWWMRRIMQGVYGGMFRWTARKYGVYHEPNHIPMRCGLPTVTTIHDLSVVLHPEWHPADRVRWYESEFEKGVRRTRLFIAASEFTKGEMVRHLNVPGERVRVTYQGPRAAFRRPCEEERGDVLKRLGLEEGFFLYVGTLEPRKNVSGLLEAFAGLGEGLRRRHPLVIVGAWGWKQEALRGQFGRHGLGEDQARLMGYLHDPELACLYASCRAFVWPTFYEGFGLPPLEAMACGAPVIVSREASLPEVVGEAGVLLAPSDVEGWREAMRRAAEDEGWRRRALERSLEQARRFSWERCAAETGRCYEEAAGG